MVENMQILEALELLGAAFPWEPVEIDIERRPEGKYMFNVWLKGGGSLGLSYALSTGEDPVKVALGVIEREKDRRDPAIKRKERAAQLRRELAELESVLGMPPYRPNRELAERVRDLMPKPATTIELEPATVETV